MIWLSNSTLSRLRDQLLDAGGRPSAASMADSPAEHRVVFAPLCEAMYLMMVADGDVSSEERDVLRGALRNLSDSTLRSAEIDALVAQAAKNVQAEGRDVRLRAVADDLMADRQRAEVALVLAAAIAFADNAIADNENETLNAFAEAMGIDDARAEALFDEVEKELVARAKESQNG
jgi:uncharacterized tellurite resistance protein B-like protein